MTTVRNLSLLGGLAALVAALVLFTPGPTLQTEAQELLAGVHKFGLNADIDIASAPEDVWTVGGLYPWPTSSQLVNVLSTSANDAAAGTGCRTVELAGLTAEFANQSETITLNGVTAVSSVGMYYRVLRCRCLTAGSLGVNAGDVNFNHPGPVTIAQIPADQGQTLMAIYTVPMASGGAYATILGWYLVVQNTGGQSFVTFRLVRRPNGGAWASSDIMQMSRNFQHVWYYKVPSYLEPGTDLRFTVDAVSADNTSVSAVFELAF